MPIKGPLTRRSPSIPLAPAVRHFLATEAAGGVVLAVAAVVALTWANSPWQDSYESLWQTEVVAGEDLRHFVNDGLMALFFLGVGLEIKRELVAGDLREPRVAALPGLAALGGMLVPAGLYLAINAGGGDLQGWGVPMATDIAFAVGVLALLGSRVPPALKLFLLTLAVVDDVGAIVVIAVFYAGDIDVIALLLAIAAAGAAVLLRVLRISWPPAYVALGVGCWMALYQSGIHPTLAGVAFGLLAPAAGPGSIAERLQRALHPFSSFVIVPVFALANAGVVVTSDALAPPGAGRVAAGIVVGLVIGKVLGISGAAWLAVRSGLATLPPAVSWREVVGVSAVAGVGFTVSLFIAGLAFERPALEAAAKLAILVASILASILGTVVLLRRRDSGAA